MFIINLYRFLMGYVEISVFGEFCEKLLNQLSAAQVTIWDINSNDDILKFKISIKNFLRLRQVKGKTKLRIKILKKTGLIFIIKRYIKRAGLPIGVLLFFLTIYILSQFVWNVSVVGNNKVPKEEILAACDNLGVREGVHSKNINSQILREKLLLECDGLSWCSFNIEGSKLTVNVTEISDNNKNSVASNIFSDFDCIITEILVESGLANVKIGDAVQKGDLLVSGVTDVSGVNKFVHAKANITAEITETVEVNGYFSREKRIPNGAIKQKSVIEVFNLKIPLFLGKTKGKYESNLNKESLCLLGEELPINLYTRTFNFFETHVTNYTRTELLSDLSQQIEDEISKRSASVEIISRNILENEQGITLKYDIKYHKNIGISKNLIFDVSN